MARLLLDLDTPVLARTTGVARPIISNFENNSGHVSARMQGKLASYFRQRGIIFLANGGVEKA